MRRRGGTASIAANPVLIGAATVLIAIVGIFITYNANKGLPFVPTYQITVNLPTGGGITEGAEVRVGGTRVGIVDRIDPVVQEDGTVSAALRLKLETSVEPLPADSIVKVRPRSLLGLKFLEITQGSSTTAVPQGGELPLKQARRTVDLDEFFNRFDAKTRRGLKGTLRGFGDAFAGRGQDLNIFIEGLSPLLERLDPVMRNLANPNTGLGDFFRNMGSFFEIVAPVALTQADLFVNLDTTFAALATVTREIQQTLEKAPPTERTVTAELPAVRPLLRNLELLAVDLQPGARVLPEVAPDLADALETGTPMLRKSVSFNRKLESVLETLQEFSEDAQVPLAIDKLNETVTELDPLVSFIKPSQTVCNYATVVLRNFASILSEGDSNGYWLRVVPIVALAGTNSEGGPASAPAEGPEAGNYLHSNPYPNTAAPGQERECEGGNETWVENQKVIGNPAGNQGTGTDTTESE